MWQLLTLNIYFSQVLVMTVEPGFGGQSFMEDMMPKVTTTALQNWPSGLQS